MGMGSCTHLDVSAMVLVGKSGVHLGGGERGRAGVNGGCMQVSATEGQLGVTLPCSLSSYRLTGLLSTRLLSPRSTCSLQPELLLVVGD